MSKRLFVFFLAVLLAGCGPSLSYRVEVQHDVSPEADFSRLRTYHWIPLAQTVNVADFDRDTLTSLKIAFTDAFEAKGYTRVESSPDFLVALYTVKEGTILSTDWGYNYRWDSAHWDGYWFERRVSSKEFEEGTLVLDILDAGRRELVWSGTAQALLKPGTSGAERNKKIDEAVAKLLAKFPPSE